MPAELVIALEAELDIAEAYGWYSGPTGPDWARSFLVLSMRVSKESDAHLRCTRSFTRAIAVP
jgi:hypothetical protein